jgi:acetyl esterase/lipase
MNHSVIRCVLQSCLCVIPLLCAQAAEPTRVIKLWPSTAPGEKGDIGEEKDTTKPTDGLVDGKRVMRIGNVSKPTLSIFRPPQDKDTGTAVLVMPGGAYRILAWDLEGTEVCDWLNSIGVTAALLKYRVPNRANLERHQPPLQDAQRALGLIRHHAREWQIDPQRIGAIGFSAGGHLAATLASSVEQRTYPPVDDADKASCRPDFGILIYPAYLADQQDHEQIRAESRVTTNHPPTFIAMTQNDPVRVENALFYYLALKQAKVPAELHVYPAGGHGYGLRRTEHLVTTWPDRVTDWMRSRGLLEKK